MTRLQRRQRRINRAVNTLIVIGCAAAILTARAVILELGEARAAVERAEATTRVFEAVHREAPVIEVDETACIESGEAEGEDPREDALIEAGLVGQGYYRDDIPLSYELQDVLRTACGEYGVPYHLALAVMEQESRFQMLEGDGGESFGYFQIQPRWWQWLMDETGADDLSDPVQNIRTGCAVLGYLLERYGNETDALTAYNSGGPGTSRYAAEVLERAEKWK